MNLLFAALALLRQQKLKRLFAYSSIEHMGLISIAMGIGTPLAYFAGLLHLLMHSLSKTAAFFSVGNIIHACHSQRIHRLRGLSQRMPMTGWLLFLATLALLGMPPSGLFLSELFLLYALLQTQPWLAILLIIGLGIAFVAVLLKIQSIVFSEAGPDAPKIIVEHPLQMNTSSVIHLALVFAAGLWLPVFLIKPVLVFLLTGS